MSDKQIGLSTLVNAIGREFVEKHKDSAVFSWGEEDRGLYCFLGIDLKNVARATLDASVDDWDVYASCFVKNSVAEMDRCRLPKE